MQDFQPKNPQRCHLKMHDTKERLCALKFFKIHEYRSDSALNMSFNIPHYGF